MDPRRPPFERTSCACDEDRAHCKRRPAHLIPSDVGRIAEALAAPVDQGGLGLIDRPGEVVKFLRASRGAVVMDTRSGEMFRIHTITPASDATGRCVFLDKDERCSIHEIAPFGCAYFDAHMSRREGDGRSGWGLSVIAGDPEYARLRATLPDVKETT